MKESYRTFSDVMVPMRDGTRLATDLWLPSTPGKMPVLLERTPYNKSDTFGTQTVNGLDFRAALARGFAVAVQDCRGRYRSEGIFEPFVHEAEDGADTVKWLSNRGFCDGNVCTFGASYLASTQMALTARAIASHRAISVQLCPAGSSAACMHRSGALEFGFMLAWIVDSLALADLGRRGVLRNDFLSEYLRDMAGDPQKAYRTLPIMNEHLLDLAPYAEGWMHDELAVDANIGVVTPGFSGVKVSGLHIAGWNDIFLEGTLANFLALRSPAVDESVRDSQFLVVGPWSHGNMSDWQGDEWLGLEAAGSVDWLTEMQLDFFDAAIGRSRLERPRVQYFVSGTNEWKASDDWPAPTEEKALYLESFGRLVEAPPCEDGFDEFVSDTLDPVPTVGGATFLPGVRLGKNSGPKMQADVEARADVLVYVCGSLAVDMTVCGLIELELWASSSCEDCDWTVRLTDVDERGVSVGVVDGVLRSRYRSGPVPVPLVPGRPEKFRIAVGSICHCFKRGHQVGVQIACSNFPRFDRNPQCMVDPVKAVAKDFVPGRQRVFRSRLRASAVLLPVCGRG